MRLPFICTALIMLLLGCTKIEVEGTPLPSLKNLRPTTISTRFCVADIRVDNTDWQRMLRYYRKPIVAPAHLYFYNENKKRVLDSLPVKIEIKGNASSAYAMKSIGVLFDQPLNNDSAQLIQPPMPAPGHSLSTLYAIRFRNGGQHFGRSMIKDLAYTELALEAGIDVELMYYKPVHVFINGEYYGFFNLRTENEEFGMAGLSQARVSSITTMDSQKGDADFEWESGPKTPAEKLLQAIDNQDAEEIQKLMDVSSFTDYLLYEDYIGNYDWPNNNLRLYSVDEGPFRFVLYDSDYAADRPKDPKLPEMEALDGGMAETYRALKKMPGYYDALRQRQKELYQVLTPEKFNDILHQLANEVEDDIPYLIAKYRQPGSMLEWRAELDIVKREFYTQDKYIRARHKID